MWPYPEVRNVADIVRYNARHHPDKEGLLFEGNALTMSKIDALTNQYANALIDAGVKPQQRVTFYGQNSDDFLIALLGTAKVSATFVPLNWRLAAKELVPIINDASPSFALVATELANEWQSVFDEGGFKFPIQNITSGVVENNPFRKWIATFSEEDPRLECPIDDNAWLLYTSGTTGVPKGVELMHSGIINMRMCEHLETAYTWCESDTFLLTTPNFHLLGIGLTIQAFFNGATIAVVRAFEPSLVLNEITQKKPTILALAPVMIQMLLRSPGCDNTDFSSIREVVYAGSSISLACIKEALERMPCRFMQFYGSTESGGALTLLRPEEHDLSDEKRLTSCGKPLPLIDIRIVDHAGNDVEDGMPGEMLVRTPGINKGYWRRPKPWQEAYKNGWFKTGDVAYRDEDGFLYIVDRVKDMIVTGGENVYSTEVENCLSVHPAIQQVAIIGVPSDLWGEEVKAMVIVKEDAQVSENEIISFAKQSLAGYKCPKSISFVDSFPVNANGKVLKRELRRPFLGV